MGDDVEIIQDCPIEERSKSELIEECKKLDLDHTGNKTKLIKRLQDYTNTRKAESAEEEVNSLVEDEIECSPINNDNENGSIESWTKQEIIDKCMQLNLDHSGNKLALIKRIQDSWNSQNLKIEESCINPEIEVTCNERDTKISDEKEENFNVSNEPEDSPIESLTKQELIDKCQKLNLDYSGNKLALVKRVKDFWSSRNNETDKEKSTNIPEE